MWIIIAIIIVLSIIAIYVIYRYKKQLDEINNTKPVLELPVHKDDKECDADDESDEKSKEDADADADAEAEAEAEAEEKAESASSSEEESEEESESEEEPIKLKDPESVENRNTIASNICANFGTKMMDFVEEEDKDSIKLVD